MIVRFRWCKMNNGNFLKSDYGGYLEVLQPFTSKAD